MDGFFSKKEYAARPATKLTTKLHLFLCLECSIWQVFFKKSFTDSITARFRSRSLSVRCSIPGFLVFFFCLMISSTPFSRSSTNNFLDAYPLSANSFPKRFFVRDFMTFLLRSSVRRKRAEVVQKMLNSHHRVKDYVQKIFLILCRSCQCHRKLI